MSRHLSVRLGARLVGTLAQDRHGSLSFTYDPVWMAENDATPLSLSMPFGGSPFGDRAVKSFFGGYLPDSSRVRREIAKFFKISPNSTYQMLGAIGRDCAGALSLWSEDSSVVPDERSLPAFAPLDEEGLAEAFAELRHRPLLAGPRRLRLSLAGAQSKTAVYVTDHGEIALPQDDYPSSHIVKPELDGYFASIASIEYFCLELARRVGLRVPAAQYGTAGGTPYLLVERFDRLRRDDGRIERVHQEDFCQALGISSDRKYEREGGPGLVQCFEVAEKLRRPARERLRLLDLALFNFLIGNGDAHGKNFSILYSPSGPELAPVYDVVSTLVYEEDERQGLDPRMAMRVGKQYDARRVGPGDWQVLADRATLSWPGIRKRLGDMRTAIRTIAPRLEEELAAGAVVTPVLHRAVELILQRGESIRSRHGLDPAR